MPDLYVVEAFSDEEREILLRYFTNVERPVFALKNLPEIVKAGLFARYSRTPKSLRRLFLDEFYAGEDLLTGEGPGSKKAEELYKRIFIEYGDDSVAQLGGAHVAVEQGSNLLTKILERGRLAGYLEQSTRYIPYADKPGGRYRYHTPTEVIDAGLDAEYRRVMDALFDRYAEAVPKMIAGYEQRFPKQPEDTKLVYTQTIRAKALDAIRGMLPAAVTSNTGVYAAGQALEALLLRMQASPLAEAREIGEMMLGELRHVIPSFLTRVDQPDRGIAWSRYLADIRDDVASVVETLAVKAEAEDRPLVSLTWFDPDGEVEIAAGLLYEASGMPDDRARRMASTVEPEAMDRLWRAALGDRANRRHKPGRAFERTSYRFDVLSDYGAFRDLQRHRMLTIEWQRLTPHLGSEVSADVIDLGCGELFEANLSESAALHGRLVEACGPEVAQYAVCMAYRIRYSMQMNAREAMHLIELRTSPQGHASYRAVAHEMHRLIRDVAGHRQIAEAMSHVSHEAVDLERLDAERRADLRRREAAEAARADLRGRLDELRARRQPQAANPLPRPKAVLAIPSDSSGGIEHFLNELEQVDACDLRVPTSWKQNGFGAQSRSLQALATWASKRGGGFGLLGVRERESIEAFGESDHGCALRLLGVGLATSELGEVTEIAAKRADERLLGMTASLRRAGGGRSVYLLASDFGPSPLPGWLFSAGGLISDEGFSGLASLVSAKLISRTDRRSSSARAGDWLTVVLRELLKNAVQWGRLESSSRARPWISGLTARRFTARQVADTKSVDGPIHRFVSKSSIDDLVEVSVWDNGPGLAHRRHQQLLAQGGTGDDLEADALRDCLMRHWSFSGDPKRGIGLATAMAHMSHLGGFMAIRAGRLSVYRDFVERPIGSPQQKTRDDFIADWDQGGEALVDRAHVVGTVITMLLRVPR